MKKKICTPALKYFDDCVFWTMHNIVCVIWCLFLFIFGGLDKVFWSKRGFRGWSQWFVLPSRDWWKLLDIDVEKKVDWAFPDAFSDRSTRHIEIIPSSLFWLIRLREELSLDQDNDISPFYESWTERYFVSHRLDLNQDTALMFVQDSSFVIAYLIAGGSW